MEWVLVWVLCAIAAAIIGSRKGEAGMGFILGALLGPFGVLFALLSQGNRKPCPYCKELIRKEATVCPHCQKDLSPQAPAPAAGPSGESG